MSKTSAHKNLPVHMYLFIFWSSVNARTSCYTKTSVHILSICLTLVTCPYLRHLSMSKTAAYKKSSVHKSSVHKSSVHKESSIHKLMIDLHGYAVTRNDRYTQVMVCSNQRDGRLFLSSVSSLHIQANCLHLDHLHIKRLFSSIPADRFINMTHFKAFFMFKIFDMFIFVDNLYIVSFTQTICKSKLSVFLDLIVFIFKLGNHEISDVVAHPRIIWKRGR